MKAKLWIPLVLAGLAAAGVGYTVLARSPQWTTSSPEALVEFQAGNDARMKYYWGDAIVHLRKAVALDPNFVFAKLVLANTLRMEDVKAADELFTEVFAADTSGLTARERMFVDRARALHDGDSKMADDVLDRYLQDHPDDPYALESKATTAWVHGDLATAERIFRHILDIRPNWVGAYNMLGYVTMRQGRFVEAEEYLTSYRFIAPDQANPHDSLGELFTLLGRYDEAEASINRALEIKPDFFNSYDTLFLIANLRDDKAGMAEVIRRAEQAKVWSPEMLAMFRCGAHLAELGEARDWQGLVAEGDTPCVTEGSPFVGAAQIVHRAACVLHDWPLADRIEARAHEALDPKAGSEKSEKSGGLDRDVMTASVAHMAAVRAAVEGHLAEAVKSCREADEGLSYTNAALGTFKLVNRLLLVEILRAEGDDAEAHRVLAQVRAVNPALVARFEERGLSILGLEQH